MSNVLVVNGTVHSSVALETLPVLPLNASPETDEPDPLILVLAVPKSATSVQLEPLNDSVIARLPPGVPPPKANPEVVLPLPPGNCLPVFKFPTSVQLDPFQISVSLWVSSPPKNIADELLGPAPAPPCLCVFTLLTSDQLDPFHVSVLAVRLPSLPENKRALS